MTPYTLATPGTARRTLDQAPDIAPGLFIAQTRQAAARDCPEWIGNSLFALGFGVLVVLGLCL